LRSTNLDSWPKDSYKVKAMNNEVLSVVASHETIMLVIVVATSKA